MEMLLLAMVFGWVVKNGVKDLVHTGATAICAVQGKPAPSWGSTRRMKRPNGAATRYFRELWNDSWDDALKRHQARHARRDAAGPGDAGGVARSLFAGHFRDGLRFMHRRWDATWVRLKILRNLKRRGTSPGEQTVPGEVVPEPPVPAEPGPADQPADGTDPLFSTAHEDEDGPGTCSKCGGTVLTDRAVCSMCTYLMQQERRNQDSPLGPVIDRYLRRKYPDPDEETPPATRPGEDPWIQQSDDPTTIHPGDARIEMFGGVRPIRIDMTDLQQDTTQEGTPTMTAMPTAEVVGLDQAISYCEASAVAHREQIVVIERTRAALDAGDVTSPASGFLTAAMEANTSAQSAMEAAAAELTKQKSIQEQYDANPGAGTREFITGGR